MHFRHHDDPTVLTITGQDVRTARRSLGLDQTTFANLAGVNQSTISRWERGRSLVDQDQYLAIMERLGLSDPTAKPAGPLEKVDIEGHWPSLIRFYRHSRGISQMALAEIMDVDMTTIYRWENGLYPPALKEQQKLRDLLLRPLSLNAHLSGIEQRIANSRQGVSLAFGYIWIAFSESVRLRWLALGYDLNKNPSFAPHEGNRSDESRVTHTDWTEERLRAGFWRGEVPVSRCTFPNGKSQLKVSAFPLLFEDNTTLVILHTRNVDLPAGNVRTDRAFSITHADEIVG